jgi:hypothetical protein
MTSTCVGSYVTRWEKGKSSTVVKFFFFSADGSGTIMVRGCALDSGTLTTDTEIIRMSHCGSFYYDDK